MRHHNCTRHFVATSVDIGSQNGSTTAKTLWQCCRKHCRAALMAAVTLDTAVQG
jgi:hypothetical protein